MLRLLNKAFKRRRSMTTLHPPETFGMAKFGWIMSTFPVSTYPLRRASSSQLSMMEAWVLETGRGGRKRTRRGGRALPPNSILTPASMTLITKLEARSEWAVLLDRREPRTPLGAGPGVRGRTNAVHLFMLRRAPGFRGGGFL